MGLCYAKDGNSLGHRPGGGSWDKDLCFAAGGYKFMPMSREWENINSNFPCDPIATCNGTNIPSTAIGGKVCGKGNVEFVCAGSANGGEWRDSGIACEPGASGACATSCGPMTLCGGGKIEKSKIGAKECGDKNLTYVCGPDGNWVVGGSEGKETCPCMTICPDLRVCDGSMLSKAPVGKEVCSIDRKMRICQSNMNAPPEWTYGKKCACPDDPPEPTVSPVGAASTASAASPVAAASPVDAASASNNMIIISVFVLLFIMIMVVVLVFAMRAKRGRYEDLSV